MTPDLKNFIRKCQHCNQTETYLLPLDPGTARLVVEIARGIRAKGINAIHPRKEIEPTGALSSNDVGNLSRPHRHGLIAKVKGNPGNWLLTSKGAVFLRGEPVPRYAVVSKVTGHQIGYAEPEKYRTTLRDLVGQDFPWEGIGFDIQGGQVVRTLEDLKTPKPRQTETASLGI